jgi:hypothetical protein
LEDGLDKIHTESSDTSKADDDRKKGYSNNSNTLSFFIHWPYYVRYKLAEEINTQIDVMQGTLEELVVNLNERRYGYQSI